MNKNAFPCESPFVLFECVFKGCNILCEDTEFGSHNVWMDIWRLLYSL